MGKKNVSDALHASSKVEMFSRFVQLPKKDKYDIVHKMITLLEQMEMADKKPLAKQWRPVKAVFVPPKEFKIGRGCND